MLMTILAAMAFPFPLAGALSGAIIPPDVIVVLRSDHTPAIEMARLNRKYGVGIGYRCATFNGFAAYAAPNVLQALRSDPVVTGILPNRGSPERLCAGH